MSVLETLVEVALGDQEDFLKIKETLTRIGSHQKKIENFINLAISFINKENITSFISKSYLNLMENHQTFLTMTGQEGMQL